jgi:hypothetical protein
VDRRRLVHAVPNIEQFLESAFEHGESISRLTAQLIGLLDDYGAKELAAAVVEALERNTPRAASVAFILARRHRSASRAILPNRSISTSRASRSFRTNPSTEVYDELSDDSSPGLLQGLSAGRDLAAQFARIGLQSDCRPT